MTQLDSKPNVDESVLRGAIREQYGLVATDPEGGHHFHTGRPLAEKLRYEDAWVDKLPPSVVESFAGTGNPFSIGVLAPGERVMDVGSGAGMDSLIAAGMVSQEGSVVGVDMTPEMLAKARAGAAQLGLANEEFKEGLAEAAPVPDGWADVVISNGVVNLCLDKPAVFREMNRVLRPGGRLQIGDILVKTAVPESAKLEIDLWTG